MKVLVTGATGFIGRYVVETLLKHNAEVIASSVENDISSFSWYNSIKYIPFDLKELDESVDYFHYFDRPDLMVHLVWEGLPNYRSMHHLEINLPRHKAFLKKIIEDGVKDVCVAGTCFEYGMQEGCLSEDMPAMPANPYATAKNEIRKFLEKLQNEQRFTLKWLRLFYVYGKGQNPKSLFSMLEKAIENNEQVFNMSGGEQVRDYLPVELLAEYIVKISMQTNISGIINCCSGQPKTLKETVEDYLRKRGKKIKLNLGYYTYRDYEPMKLWGDTTKLHKIIIQHI